MYKCILHIISFLFIFQTMPLKANRLQSNQSFVGGFLSDTLVKTPVGYSSISTLQKSDLVTSYSFNHNFVTKKISHIHTRTINRYLKMYCDNECICVAPDQLFYLPRENSWIKAEYITPYHIFLKNGTDFFSFNHISEVKEETSVYDLSVGLLHNFCISSYDIPVHNVIPFIAIGATWAFGGGCVELVALSGGILCGAYGLFCGVDYLSKEMKASAHFPLENSNFSQSSYSNAFLKFELPPYPDENKWNHFVNNNEHDHGFGKIPDGPSPEKDKIWKAVQKVLIAGIAAHQYTNGVNYEVSGMTEIGLLSVRGRVIDGVIYIGTMWINQFGNSINRVF